MSYYVLVFDPDVDLADVLVSQIDANLNQFGSGTPIGTRAASRAGIKYFDEVTKFEYLCTVTDGTIGGTTWVQQIYSIENATTTAFGVVTLATQAQVNAGTSTTAVVTPSSLGALARSGVNGDINSLTAMTTPLSISQGGTGVNTLEEILLELFPTMSGTTSGEVLTNDGAGNIAWINYRKNNVVVINTTNPLVMYSVNLITNLITATIPSPTNVGDELIMAFTSGGAGSTLHMAGGELFEGQSADVVVDSASPMRIVWTGSVNGWKVIR